MVRDRGHRARRCSGRCWASLRRRRRRRQRRALDATASYDAHTANGASGDAAGGTAVDADPPVDSTSASPFGARRCFALTFALLAIGTAVGLAAFGVFVAMGVSSGEIPVVASEHSQFTAQTTANRLFQGGHDASAEGDFEAEYCVPDAAYDPPSVLPTSAADCGPSGAHLSTELGAGERAGFAALLEQHGGAFATAPGNLTTAAERSIPLRAGAVPVSCRSPRYTAEKREAVAGQCRIALDTGVTMPSLGNVGSHSMPK